MEGLEGEVERAILILKTWSVLGERWSRTELMKVMVSGAAGGSVDGIIASTFGVDGVVVWRIVV